MIHHGDCLEVMATMPDASVDAIVTDPPYGISFMAKHWDRGAPGVDFWREMLRVAKPGAYLLSFAGTRTVHRIGVAIENAGWIIRDTLVWGFAQGFPKGRANLKPAWEPIVMARKPGPLRHLNIDECRIPGVWTGGPSRQAEDFTGGSFAGGNGKGPADIIKEQNAAGRWPANVILTDPIFDGGIEGVVGGGQASPGTAAGKKGSSGFVDGYDGEYDVPYGDRGTYSRFFILPKADRQDREPAVRHACSSDALRPWWCVTHDCEWPPGTVCPGARARANTHPTVKSTELMRHLVRLVTPSGGVVLDPFAGSGSTLIAAEQEGFEWIGIEKEAEYVAIAEARLNGVQRGLGLDVPAPTRKPPKTHPDLSKHQPKVQRRPTQTVYGKFTGFGEPEEAA